MISKFAKGAMRTIKKITVKPYIKPVYNKGQIPFKGFENNKIGYDFSITVPTGLYNKAVSHLKRNRLGYELGATSVAGYVGSAYANRQHRKRNRRRIKKSNKRR